MRRPPGTCPRSTALECLHLLLQLRLERLQLERRALLHGWVVDEGLSVLGNLPLDEDEPPELEGKPVVERERSPAGSGKAGPLERIDPQIDQHRPIDLDRPAKPAA